MTKDKITNSQGIIYKLHENKRYIGTKIMKATNQKRKKRMNENNDKMATIHIIEKKKRK